MDLIDRYIAAVRRQLPQDKQDDIAQELGDSLRSEAEELALGTGRPLTEDQQSEMLKQRGHPWLMASRYLPQQHLIGPGLYPYYRQALTMVVFWVVLPLTLLGGAIGAITSADPAQVWTRVLGAAWNGGIYAVGIVTIVFAILEHERVRITALDTWNPKRLPKPAEVRTVSRSESLVGLVLTLTFLVWWIDLVRVPEFISYAGESVRITAAPIWSGLYWPILLTAVAGTAVYLVDLVRPWRSATVSMLDILVGLAHIAIATMVLQVDTWVEVSTAAQHADQAARLAFVLNNVVRVSFACIGVIAGWEVLREIWLMVKARGRRAALAL
jgi:hypothetical protein